MDTSIFFGGSVVAAVVAGSIALFAPCCISVMLPSYFATAFQNRRKLVAMTFLFGAGVATVILPIALGAAVIQRVLLEQHTAIYLVVGATLLALAVFVFGGGKVSLPMPGRRAGGRTGPLGVYTLGIFSGAASSCCAPVLAGVIALSGLASSFALSLGLGAAYVFGMVAPLFALSLLWERFDLRSSRLFRPRSVTWRVGPVRRTITASALASAVLLGLMGAGTIWIGLTTEAMPAGDGWQADVSSELQHYGKVITDALGWIPGWAAAVALLAVVALLVRRAFHELLAPVGTESSLDSERPDVDAAPDDRLEPESPKTPEYA